MTEIENKQSAYIINLCKDELLLSDESLKKEAEKFMQECYDAYQLEWMLSHGYSLSEIYTKIMDIMTEDMESGENSFPQDRNELENAIAAAREHFLYDEGFHGSIYACKDEFLEAEFLSATYMEHLLSMMPDSAKKKAFWIKIVEGGTADER